MAGEAACWAARLRRTEVSPPPPIPLEDLVPVFDLVLVEPAFVGLFRTLGCSWRR